MAAARSDLFPWWGTHALARSNRGDTPVGARSRFAFHRQGRAGDATARDGADHHHRDQSVVHDRQERSGGHHERRLYDDMERVSVFVDHCRDPSRSLIMPLPPSVSVTPTTMSLKPSSRRCPPDCRSRSRERLRTTASVTGTCITHRPRLRTGTNA